LAQSLKSFARRSNAWGMDYRLCCRVIEYLTCRRHACMISSGGWSARSARRLGSARQRPCSSLPRARASRRRKTKRKTEIRLPLLPQQRTCGDCIGRSVLCLRGRTRHSRLPRIARARIGNRRSIPRGRQRLARKNNQSEPQGSRIADGDHLAIRSCHGPLAPNSERRIVATKFAVISPKCRSRLAASGGLC